MKEKISRRKIIQSAGVATGLGAVTPLQSSGATPKVRGSADARGQIRKKVYETLFVDTHEHLFEEKERLDRRASDDWALNCRITSMRSWSSLDCRSAN